MAKVDSFIFVDESGDPGAPFVNGANGKPIPTGASRFYILSALCLSEQKLFQIEHRVMEVKTKFGYTKEIKSNDVSLALYKELLKILNELEVKTYYRLVDKAAYKGVYKVDGKPELHNVFDEYNLVKAVYFAIQHDNLDLVEVVIDRADRRLLDGKFDSFDNYLVRKVKKQIGDKDKERNRISHIVHVNSIYVNAMQMSDLISGAIRDDFTKKNTELIKVIDPKCLIKIP
jgi:hypothetical protein